MVTWGYFMFANLVAKRISKKAAAVAENIAANLIDKKDAAVANARHDRHYGKIFSRWHHNLRLISLPRVGHVFFLLRL